MQRASHALPAGERLGQIIEPRQKLDYVLSWASGLLQAVHEVVDAGDDGVIAVLNRGNGVRERESAGGDSAGDVERRRVVSKHARRYVGISYR